MLHSECSVVFIPGLEEVPWRIPLGCPATMVLGSIWFVASGGDPVEMKKKHPNGDNHTRYRQGFFVYCAFATKRCYDGPRKAVELKSTSSNIRGIQASH